MEKITRGNLRGNEEEANARMLLRSRDYAASNVALAPFPACTKRASYACNAD